MHAPAANACTTVANSSRENFSVLRAMLSTSLHELPVFHTHRATPRPEAHLKSAGTA
jgi:hypothetical protein